MLVTGAGGLLGRAVCSQLSADGVRVIAMLGPPGCGLPDPPGAEVCLEADITDARSVAAFLQDVAAVVHLAGPPSVAASYQHPAEYARTHVVGTATLLEALRHANGPLRLVHVSSAEVYATSEASSVTEDAPVAPSSPYGAVKLAAESLVRQLVPRTRLGAVVLRPFSLYGPGSPAASLVGQVVRQACEADCIVVADPRPVRDFVHVSDAARAVALAVLRPLPGQEPVVVNVGSGRGVSVVELARLAARAAGHEPDVRAGSGDRPDRAHRPAMVADTARARAVLGWATQTSLEDGLADCVRARRAAAP